MRPVAALLATAAVILAGSAAVASQNYQSAEKLIGWSVDGDRWVTLAERSSEPEVSVLWINQIGKKPIEYCNDAGDEEGPGMGGGCEKDRDLGIELERVDLVGHRKLREHKLTRLKPAMRHAFEVFFDLEHDRLRKDKCVKTFKVAPRFPIRPIEVTVEQCLIKVIGGFVHPEGKRLLIKIEMEWDDTSEELTTYNEITYTLVKL